MDRFAVSKGLLEFDRINDVGKKQSQQPSAMFALKFFNLCPSLDRDLLQFPDREHQSTKFSRCNQWNKEQRGVCGAQCDQRHSTPTIGRFSDDQFDNIRQQVLI
jgi:hypothetical protein